MAALGMLIFRQLGDVRRDPPRLVALFLSALRNSPALRALSNWQTGK